MSSADPPPPRYTRAARTPDKSPTPTQTMTRPKQSPHPQQGFGLPPEADTAPTLPPAAQVPTQNFSTGQFQATPPALDPFMTGRLQAIDPGATPPTTNLREAFEQPPDRLSYGIWGAAVGTIIGISLGILNALFEGVYPSDNQGPLIIFALLGMLIGGSVSAARPRQMSHIIKDLFYFYR